MADELLKCDGTDPIHIPAWEPIVGDSTLDNGGRIGDLLKIARAHLEDAKEKGELREQDAGAAYTSAILESYKTAVAFELAYNKSSLELCYLQAQIDKLKCDCDNTTRKTDSDILLNLAQIEKLKCDCENDTDRTESTISLNAAQENKLACDCCNTSASTAADIQYRMQQIEKSICDCENSTIISAAQGKLYERQAAGFDDNANQKLYDSQLSAWSMVFADAENLDVVTPSINDANMNQTYSRLCKRLAESAGSECELVVN